MAAGQRRGKPDTPAGAHPGDPHGVRPHREPARDRGCAAARGGRIPVPSIFSDAPWWVTWVVGPAYTVAALLVGTYWVTRRTVGVLRWAIEERRPTREDQRNTFLAPWRLAEIHLVLWGVGAALLTTLYGLPTPGSSPASCSPSGSPGSWCPPAATCSPNSRCGRWPRRRWRPGARPGGWPRASWAGP